MSRHESEWPTPQVTEILSAPLTISMSERGHFFRGSWHLSVNSAGQAHLTVDTWPTTIVHRFDVTESQLKELRDALIREKFFYLNEEYGEHIPEGSTDTLTIAVGDHVKTIRLSYLTNWVHFDRERLKEPARAVKLRLLIRNWFSHPDAVDSRQYDQMVLDAAE